jgi:hypothetical protein
VNAPVSCTSSTATAESVADSWILESSPSSTHGGDSVLKVESKSGANARALFRFALPSIPAGCEVVQAKLRLYSSAYKDGRTLEAVRLGASWTESDVTWANKPATAGTAATTTSGSGYREWTVTAQVVEMYTNGNYGFLIRDATENGGGFDQGFHSRRKGSDNPPQLVITFD